MPATITPTALVMVTRYVGVCQICEAEHRLTTDAFPSLGVYGTEHKVVHHGYQRPGDGQIHGDCDGVGEVPFEVSCEATKRYRAAIAVRRELSAARLGQLRRGVVAELHVPSWRRGEPAKVVRVGDVTWSLELSNKIGGRSTVRTFADHLDLELVTRDAGLAQVEVYFRDRTGLPMFQGYVTDLEPRRLAGRWPPPPPPGAGRWAAEARK